MTKYIIDEKTNTVRLHSRGDCHEIVEGKTYLVTTKTITEVQKDTTKYVWQHACCK